MSSLFFDTLTSKKVLLSDGALGTELQKKGLKPGDCPELWNETRGDDVCDIARSYFEAGSDVVLTNTFGGSPMKMKKPELEEKTESLNRLGVERVRQAAPEGGLVVASLGPTGEFMQPVGLITEKEMIACFEVQVRALIAGGADGILGETFTALDEAKAAIKASQANSDLPAMCTMTFDKGEKGFRTMMGVSPEQAADELQEAGANAIGTNCGNGIANMIEIVKIMKPRSDVPIVVHANAGLPEIVDGKTVFRETPEEMSGLLPDLLEAGATVVGGCCGTTPEHIKAFRETIDQWLAR